jgi:peptidoglycan hydrolase-like protein with peptidoglycan-binding domain/phosphodiesterase/alkaline phosphatase D-like protein
MRLQIIARSFLAVLLSFALISPAFAQLAGSVDTGGATAPAPVAAPAAAPAPAPVVAPVVAPVAAPAPAPVDTTPVVITTAISATPTTGTDTTTATASAPASTPTTAPASTQTQATTPTTSATVSTPAPITPTTTTNTSTAATVTTPAPTPTTPTTPAPTQTPAPTPIPTAPVTQTVAPVITPIITAPVDTTPPAIVGISSLSLEPHHASIIWTTDELATSQLEYGTTQNYGSTVTLAVSASLLHDATMLNLTPNTTYYYCIHATDLVGNMSSSCGHSFTTAADAIVLDTTPPVVSLVSVAPITTSTATVAWTTNELAQSHVEYGITDAYGSASVSESDFALTHAAPLAGLSPDTTYHYRIHTRDVSGNTMVTPDNTFTTNSPVGTTSSEQTTTAAPTITASVPPVSNSGTSATVATPGGSATIATGADVTAPTTSGVFESSVGSSVASITWVTDELATSNLTYGTTMSYGTQATLPATALLAHSATLTGLSPNTTYYYCIRSTDVVGNTANSCGYSFTTGAAPVVNVKPPIVVASVATVVTASSADIAWTTTDLADTQVDYGTTINYGLQTPLGSTFTLSGTIPLSGLTPNTTYHFRARSYDGAGNVVIGTDQTFMTGALPVVASVPSVAVVVPQTITATSPSALASTTNTTSISAPALVLSSVASNSISEVGAVISWTTDLPSDSNVQYGTADRFNKTAGSATLTTSHSVSLSGLSPNTAYEFRVASTPAGIGAVQTTSDVHDFSTLTQPIVIDPAANITSLSSSNITSTSAAIAWTTNEATHGAIEYGLTTVYENSAQDASMVLSHTTNLSGLLPGATYHFRVKAIDSAENITYSIDHTFTTPGVSLAATAPAPAIAASAGTTVASSTTTTPTTPVTTSADVPTPSIVKVESTDSQVLFIVNPQVSTTPASQATTTDSTVIVVRTDGTYPTSPTDGRVIYSGSSSTFTDTNLRNGSTYDYSVYTRSPSGQYSAPIHIGATPKAGVEQVQLSENPIIKPAAVTQHFTTDFSIGANDPEIEHLQQILNTQSVHPTGLTTGYFGPLTQDSLKRLQARYKLPQTGAVDATTRPVLNQLAQGWMTIGAPTALAGIAADVKPGDSGQGVTDLQKFLAYDGSYKGSITGTYGPLTKQAVATFQKKYGVTPVTGYVGPKTRHTIQAVLGQ